MLAYDPQRAIAALAKADKKLAKVIRKAEFTLKPQRSQDVFQSLMRAIVYQQLSGKAAATILSRVHAIYDEGPRVPPAKIVATPDEQLRAAGLSGNKVLSVKDLALKTLDGTVPPLAKLRKLSDEEIVARLTQVRGIGPWTVEMLLIFRLGRPDVLPVSDLGVQRGFQLTYGLAELPKPDVMRAHAEKWRPYRSVASWYMWRAVEQLG